MKLDKPTHQDTDDYHNSVIYAYLTLTADRLSHLCDFVALKRTKSELHKQALRHKTIFKKIPESNISKAINQLKTVLMLLLLMILHISICAEKKKSVFV